MSIVFWNNWVTEEEFIFISFQVQKEPRIWQLLLGLMGFGIVIII